MTTPIGSIRTTSIPTVKAYLFAQFQANITPNANPDYPLLVSYDLPGTNQPPEMVVVSSVENRTTEPYQMIGSGASGWIYERYELSVIIAVFRGGDDAQDVYERAYAILGQVESIVRSDPSLGGLVVQAYPLHSRDEATWEQKRMGRIVTIEHTIRIEAQV